MRKLTTVLLLIMLVVSLSACGENNDQVSNISAPIENISEPFSSDISDSDNCILTNDSSIASTKDIISTLAGLPDRIPGSDSNNKATEWIAKQYELLKLKPLAKENYFWSYQQNINGQVVEAQNIVGYIDGSSSNQAIVISCHFDGVTGSSGAVDNASGVAAMLRVAANLSAVSDELQADYIFCAFNGEERGYAGSIAFVSQFKGQYETIHNINFDCVGVIDGGSYMFGVTEEDVGYKLNMAIRPFLDKGKLTYSDYPVRGIRSDHISFENADIPNIDFTQTNIAKYVHSISDKIEQLDTAQIDLLADCVTEFILNYFQITE